MTTTPYANKFEASTTYKEFQGKLSLPKERAINDLLDWRLKLMGYRDTENDVVYKIQFEYEIEATDTLLKRL